MISPSRLFYKTKLLFLPFRVVHHHRTASGFIVRSAFHVHPKSQTTDFSLSSFSAVRNLKLCLPPAPNHPN
jgi:hypothetical protein